VWLIIWRKVFAPEEPRNRVVQVKRFGTVLPRPANHIASGGAQDLTSLPTHCRDQRAGVRLGRLHLAIRTMSRSIAISASSADGRPQMRLPMRPSFAQGLLHSSNTASGGMGRYRLPIGDQRDAPKQEGIARATTMIGMANLVYNIKRFIFLRKIGIA
jgi:hypothetical protein